MASELARRPRAVPVPRVRPETQLAIDAAVGVAGAAVAATVALGRAGARVVAPVARVLWQPPVLPRGLQPRSVVHAASRAGRAERLLLSRRLAILLDAWTPLVAEALVSRLDLTRLVDDHVDLDALVATVDLDRAVAMVDLDAAVARVDVDAVVRRVALEAIIERIDVDAIVASVDLDAVVDRIDLDDIAGRLDVDAVVARVDIGAVVDRIDLDDIATRLDVDAVVARVDLDAILDRLDLAEIVGEVLDEIDLPAIIRDSTGSMASETVRGVRMTGISADDAISRAVDRALFRRRRHADRGGGAP